MSSSETLARIDYLHTRYHRKALVGKWLYYSLSCSQLLIATSIPLVAIVSPSSSGPMVNGLLGASILVLQGLQQIFRPNHRWVQNRVAARQLASEKHLYIARAGPYRSLDDAEALVKLAERIEDFALRQNDQWEQMMENMLQSENSERRTRREKRASLSAGK